MLHTVARSCYLVRLAAIKLGRVGFMKLFVRELVLVTVAFDDC